MYRQVKNVISYSNNITCLGKNRYLSNNAYIDVKDEVMSALDAGKPVVALESTIISHGMPFPDNVQCALDVERIVREQGAIPATVAIIKGRIKVGLSKNELTYFGDIQKSNPIKTSRRDLAFVVSNNLNGGTTVCGTLLVANKVAIPVFATGGLGGVHRGAHKTFDISSDLIELGKSAVAVVSSGVKSILDIPKTLEYLETQGVLVATFGSNTEFPAFYSRASGSKAPYCVKSAIEAAKIIKCNRDLGLNSGMLFAVPIPEQYSLPPEIINNAIEEALTESEQHLEIMGKEVTPYLLSQVAKITGGRSLESNFALIKNNAEIGAKIAVALSNLETKHNDPQCGGTPRDYEALKGRPVVIGGSNLDCSAHLTCSELKGDP